jgi:hypothetical protein
MHPAGKITIKDGDLSLVLLHAVPQVSDMDQLLKFFKWAFVNKEKIWDSWIKEDAVQPKADAFKAANPDTPFDWERHAITDADDYPEYTGCTGKTAELIYSTPAQERVWDFREAVPRESKFATAVYLYFADTLSPYEQINNVEEAAKPELLGQMAYDMTLTTPQTPDGEIKVTYRLYSLDGAEIPAYTFDNMLIDEAAAILAADNKVEDLASL